MDAFDILHEAGRPMTVSAVTPSGIEIINQAVTQLINEAIAISIAQERQRCARVVRSEIRQGGIPMDGPAFNRVLENIAKEIEADGQ